MAKMGLQMGLSGARLTKKQFRWMFKVDDVIGDTQAINALPPQKSARPNVAFKAIQAKHLIEDVYYPAKPDWKPINVTVWDVQHREHPIFNWLQEVYRPGAGQFLAPTERQTDGRQGFIKSRCSLFMLNGCGDIIEEWFYEDCWPEAINFQTLDMSQKGLVMCDLTLRYARAYLNVAENSLPVSRPSHNYAIIDP